MLYANNLGGPASEYFVRRFKLMTDAVVVAALHGQAKLDNDG